MLRPLRVAAAALLLAATAACSSDPGPQAKDGGDAVPVVRVAGATSNPLEQSSIEFVRDNIAADYGIQIEYVHIEETRVILEATESKEVDANVAMHEVYMQGQNEALGFHLAAVAPLFQQRQVLYSKKFATLEEVPDGAQVAVSNSPIAISTALNFLQEVDLVELDKDVPLAQITVEDIVANPKNLQFVTVDSVARSLDDVDLATHGAYQFHVADIPADYEIAAIPGLPAYALQLVVHQDNVDRPDIVSLTEAFEDPRLDEFVSANWSELVTPL